MTNGIFAIGSAINYNGFPIEKQAGNLQSRDEDF